MDEDKLMNEDERFLHKWLVESMWMTLFDLPMCTRASCYNAGSKELHKCPLKVEIYDDKDTLCGCCDRCENACAMDV